MGVGARLITRIERGHVGTPLGAVFEAANERGVPLFGVEPEEVGHVAARQRDRLTLLPSRVRAPLLFIDDNF